MATRREIIERDLCRGGREGPTKKDHRDSNSHDGASDVEKIDVKEFAETLGDIVMSAKDGAGPQKLDNVLSYKSA